MPLELKLEILSVDKIGRIITVKDDTGVYDPVDNPGGYGTPNIETSDVQGLYFSISNYCSNKVYWFRAEREYMNIPNFIVMDIDSVMDGSEDVQLTTGMFGITPIDKGVAEFQDGVLDINYYVYLNAVEVSGVKGAIYITGDDLPDYQTLDSILINGKMYSIDHNKPVGDGKTMFLTEPLLDNADEAYPAYRVNQKVFMDKWSLRVMSAMSGKLAGSYCNGCGDTVAQKILLTIKHNRDAALLDFIEEDYKGANSKLKYAQQLSYRLC